MTSVWRTFQTTLDDRRTSLLRLGLFIGFSFFAYRYFNSDLWPFIYDEPALLGQTRALLLAHQFATHSALVGTQGVQYGPTTYWLYGAVHTLLGSDVETHVLVMLTLLTASNATVAFSIGRLYGDRYIVPATLGVLVASSPYQFFWSRMAWDPLVNVCTGFIIALLCTKKRLSVWRALAIGAFIGFGVSTHPAMVPLAGVALLLVFYRSPVGRRCRQMSLAAFVAFIVNLPYLYYLASADRGAAAAKKAVSFELLPRFFSEPVRVSTLAGIDYFFDSDWPAFQRFSSVSAEAVAAATGVLPWLAVIAAVGLLLTLWLRRQSAQRVITLGAIVVWGGYVVFYTYLRLDPHPHYQFSIWWVMLVPIAGLLGWVKPQRRLFAVGVACCWGIAVFQFAFIVNWMHFVRERGGIRDIHYGSPISQQRRAVRQLCAQTRWVTYVVNQTRVFPVSLGYIASTEPDCVGKRLVFDDYPGVLKPGEGRMVLRYAGPDTAMLQVTNLP